MMLRRLCTFRSVTRPLYRIPVSYQATCSKRKKYLNNVKAPVETDSTGPTDPITDVIDTLCESTNVKQRKYQNNRTKIPTIETVQTDGSEKSDPITDVINTLYKHTNVKQRKYRNKTADSTDASQVKNDSTNDSVSTDTNQIKNDNTITVGNSYANITVDSPLLKDFLRKTLSVKELIKEHSLVKRNFVVAKYNKCFDFIGEKIDDEKYMKGYWALCAAIGASTAFLGNIDYLVDATTIFDYMFHTMGLTGVTILGGFTGAFMGVISYQLLMVLMGGCLVVVPVLIASGIIFLPVWLFKKKKHPVKKRYNYSH